MRAAVAPREAACRRFPALPNPTGICDLWFLNVESGFRLSLILTSFSKGISGPTLHLKSFAGRVMRSDGSRSNNHVPFTSLQYLCHPAV